MPLPIPLSKKLEERDMLKVIMHCYWFQMFTMRSSLSFPLFTVKMFSRLSQYWSSAAKAASTYSVVSNLAISSCAFSLLITILATNF